MAEKYPPTQREKHILRARQRRIARIRFFGLSAVCILLLAGVITAVIEMPAKLAAAKSESAAQSASQSAASQSDASAGDAGLGVFGPVQKTDLTYTPPTAAMLTLPANGRVDMSYFDDALFIGDSLTQGFQVYASGIKNAKYAAYVGAGPKQLMSGTVTNLQGETVTAITEILAAAPKKVYLLLGTNALSNLTDDALMKYYSDFLDFLAPQLPADTIYYIQSIPPVTQTKSEGDANYANSRIRALNEKLAALAYVRGWHFLDLYGALCDETQNLRGEIVTGSDGIHLNAMGYEAWKEYLVTHTAYSSTSPYIAGSPYAPAG